MPDHLLAPPELPRVSQPRRQVISSLAPRRQQNTEGKDICLMGGGEFARSLFEAGLIDEIGLNIHPVLLGQGIPLFHAMNRQIDMELKECRAFSNGCVYVTYRVTPFEGPSAPSL